MPKIIFNFAKDGTVTCKTSGFKGKACMDASKEIEKALGMVEGTKKTEEFYLPNNELQRISNVEGEGGEK